MPMTIFLELWTFLTNYRSVDRRNYKYRVMGNIQCAVITAKR